MGSVQNADYLLEKGEGPWELFVGAAVNQAIAMQCGLNRPHGSKEHGLLALEGWHTGKRSSEVSRSLFSLGMNMTDSGLLTCSVKYFLVLVLMGF